jgi:hypothetical protein
LSVDTCTHCEFLTQCDERFVGGFGEAQSGALGKAVIAQNHEAQALSAADAIQTRRRQAGCGDCQINVPARQELHHLVLRGLTEGEIDPRRCSPKSAQQIWNKPTGKRMQERQPHRTAIGIAQRGDAFGWRN